MLSTMTINVLSNLCYEFLKRSVTFSKDKFISYVAKQNIIQDEDTISRIANKVAELGLNGEMSEKSIERKIESSESLVELLNKIPPTNTQNITQHNIHGDNIGRDKIIN